MIICKKSDFWNGKKNGSYIIPENFIEPDYLALQYPEIKDYIANNKRVKSFLFTFENSEDEKKYNDFRNKAIADRKIAARENNILAAREVLPDAAAKVIENWNIISKSPYSNSFYNTDDITWDYKPEGSLRLSDHWNFYTNGEQHCKLNITDEYIAGIWILAEYKNGVYNVIQKF